MMTPSNQLTSSDNEILLQFILSLTHVESDIEMDLSFDLLKKLIPFDTYGIAHAFISGHRIHSLQSIRWFREIEGFETHYFGNRLYDIDPVATIAIEQVLDKKPSCQFWGDSYENRFNQRFFDEIKPFGMDKLAGYTHIRRLNPVSFCSFSIAGLNLGDTVDNRIIDILNHVILAIASVSQTEQIGILERLTSRQFEVFQLIQTSMTYDQIASVLSIKRSAVDKAVGRIKKKISFSSRSDLPYGAKEAK